MKKAIRNIGIFLVAALLFIQVFRPEKNNNFDQAGQAFISQYAVNDEISGILKTSCFDCHSEKTNYPWYHNIQPIGFWLNDHIDEGKHELNFDSFSYYSLKKQLHKLDEVEEMVEHDEMPLNSYLWVHSEAKLSEDQKSKLISWSKELKNTLAQAKTE